MDSQKQKLILVAELSSLVFLVFRGVVWLVDHTSSHHSLDNITGVIAFALLVLFIFARPNNKVEQTVQSSVAVAITIIGFGVLLCSLAGIVVLMIFLFN